MYSIVVRISIILLSLTLVHCASIKAKTPFFKGRDSAYLGAQSVPPLNIPPGYSSNSFETLYPVSNKNYTADMTQVDITPPGLEK